jgi:hypothetical protein
MTSPHEAPGGPPADGCAEFRAAVEARCAEAHTATVLQAAAAERVPETRRDLVAATHKRAEAEGAADPALRHAEKAKAREVYEEASRRAENDAELIEATAVWARAIDRINRSGRLALRAVSDANAAIASLEAAVHDAEREAQTSRIRAEQAAAACLAARVSLAACEEGAAGSGASPTELETGGGQRDSGAAEAGSGGPLVIESLVSGDRRALELTAARVADHTGFSPAEAQLQLQEFVVAVVASAADEGFYVFDTRHPFWSNLSFDEARDVMAALARLGFLFEPSEGWHAGRAPAPSDLSMALAYAGLDARNMRDLPSAENLQLLPRSIGVDARSFLAAQAPELDIDSLVRTLDRRAAQLEPLWNEWGQVRPVLLSDRHALGSVPG